MKKGLILLLIILLSGTTFSQESFRSGIFLHHSTGATIWGPNGSNTSVPDEITSYNTTNGFTGDEQCSLNESGWPTDPWNNEWERWHRIFDNEDSNADIRPILQSNKIVIIKSCFPSSSMTGWGVPSDTLSPTQKSIYNYKWHWRNFVKIMESHPENFFVIWTNAPLVAGATNDNAALMSHSFCTWAKDTLANGLDPVYGTFPKNVYVFDFFHKLVGTDYKLKPEYASSSSDSHPNSAATELVAPQFVQEVFDVAIAYESFYNGELPGVPTQTSPGNHATGESLTTSLVWGAVSGATSYNVEVSTQLDFTTTIVSSTETTTSYSFTNELTNSTKYYWRVRSENAAGESSWSGVWDFTTIEAIPGVPTQTSPSNNATGESLTTSLVWEAVSGATSYNVEVSPQSDFTTTVVSSTGTTTSYSFTNELTNSTKYYWRVRSENAAGESSWSAVWDFTTIVTTNNINDSDKEEICIYPNPVSKFINIGLNKEINERINILIYSQTGQLILKRNYELNNGSDIFVNIGSLKAGLYIIKIISSDIEYKSSFVKMD